MSNILGRFTQPDPGGAGADITNPQSWNAYVGGNPLSGTDPTGMIARDGPDDGDDCYSAARESPCGGFEDGGDFYGGGFGGGSLKNGHSGGGGSIRGGAAGTATGATGTSGPAVGSPGSAPSSSGGETLGLPPGISVPLPRLASITGVGTGCEFGACGGGFFAGPGMEDHHIFPQAFQEWFAQHGIEIESYTIALSKAAHRLKPGGLHTKSGGNGMRHGRNGLKSIQMLRHSRS